jgi:phenylacetate-CoA ligase
MPVPLIATAGPIAAIINLLGTARRVEKEQWLSGNELAARRRTRLRQMLARAAESPYYGAVLREAGFGDLRTFEPRDLERLPLLDRHVMARHGLEAFLTVEREGLVGVSTSGSTGMPGRFLRSKLEESDYSARWWRVYQAYGCGMRDAQICVAILDKPDRAGPITYLRRMGVLPRTQRVASDAPPAQVLARFQALQPPVLNGYAGAIEALADHILQTGARIHPPRAVFCTAMEVTDRCLELVERAFHAPAVDVYVTNEFGVIAWACPQRRDVLHLNDDSFEVEVLAADGTPAPYGEVGELVITSLGLTSMPLIRYKMGDMAARIEGTCECGRGLGLITRVQGRTAHAIRRGDGAPITTPFITSLFGRVDAHEWVRKFQVREESGRQLRFLLDVRRAPTAGEHLRLRNSVLTALGEEFRVEFEFVDRIPNAPTGKLQYVVPLAS